jgi:hypothetical protein
LQSPPEERDLFHFHAFIYRGTLLTAGKNGTVQKMSRDALKFPPGSADMSHNGASPL